MGRGLLIAFFHFTKSSNFGNDQLRLLLNLGSLDLSNLISIFRGNILDIDLSIFLSCKHPCNSHDETCLGNMNLVNTLYDSFAW